MSIYVRLARPLAILALLTAASTRVSAATTEVASVAELQAAIAGATAGDTIIVKNGVYTTTGSVNINKVGTAASPIIVKAETVGGVEFQGTHGISLSSPAAYVTIEGFVFSHQSGRLSMPNGTHHSRYTRNVFKCVGDGPYLGVAGHDHEVDRNEFRDKSTVGNMISVSGSGSQVAQRLWVHHNYFHDFTSPGQNGAETLRFGLSGLSMSNGEGLVEYNLFVRCNGENELISNKSGGNTYRYNTLIDSPGAQLTLRHGNDCIVYGNYFRNTAGLRVYGDRHLIFSNYLENNSIGIDMGNGDGEVLDGAELTAHDRPDDAVVVYNTLINNNTQYQMGGRTGGLGALRAVVDNNIIQGGTRAFSISTTAPYTGTFANNIVWNVPNIGNVTTGFTVEDPLLAPDANGIFHIQAGSPAINSGVGAFPGVIVDQDGQPRDAAKDKGADEVSGAPVVARILNVSDVGPGIGGPTPEPTPPPIDFEAENLGHSEAGGSYSVSFEDTASGGAFASPHITNPADPLFPVRHRFVTFGGDGMPPPPDGEWIEFVIPGLPRGTYNLVLRYKSHPANRAVVRLSVDGAVQGNDLNQLSGATFKPQDFGVVRFDAPGDHVVRLAVVGKTNVPTTPWNMTADVFSFVPDSKKPVITTPLPDLTLEATGPGGAVATYSASATDIKDGLVPVVFTPPSGTELPLGTTPVTATATDFHGNVATVTFEVTVVDTTAPVLSLPADITAEATSPAGAVVAFSPSATDIVDGSVPVVSSPASGSVFALGTTAVTATATDAAGNAATGTFNVTVVDTTAPVLTVPPDVTITTCDRPSIGQATATDAVSTPVITNDAPFVFALGQTIVTWRAVDAAGNESTGIQRVTVELGDDASCCPIGSQVYVGTSATNVINGTNGSDCILGRGGDDVINALGGNDFISGGAGRDTIAAGLGNDLIMGGPGDDVIDASVGDDTVRGGAGRDTIAAGPGSDDVDGGSDTDVCAVAPDGHDVVIACP
jgi:poly(beta-D-mannuronate) lyase